MSKPDYSEKSLTEIFDSHTGKYSDKWSSYLTYYDKLLEPIRKNVKSILEIGIQNGGSLEIWAKFFPNIETIVGCDVDPKCANLVYEDPRIHVLVTDAGRPKTRSHIEQIRPNFDLIIDDGSHISSDIIKAFCLYFPLLKPGGIFIIEDLHASYWQAWQGGLSHPESSMQFLKLLADVVNFEHWGIRVRRKALFNHFYAAKKLTDELLASIASVEFTNSVCVIRKAESLPNGLGSRRVRGSEAIVFEGISTFQDTPAIYLDQSTNDFAIPNNLSISKLILMQEQLALASQRLEILETDLTERNNQVEILLSDLHQQTQNNLEVRGKSDELSKRLELAEAALLGVEASMSWKLTKPLRWVRARVAR